MPLNTGLRMKQGIGLLCLSLLIACMSTVKKVENISQRFYKPAFSLLPPQEPGWRVDVKNRYGLSFFKKAAAAGSSYVVIAESYVAPERFKSVNEFKQVMRNWLVAKNTAANRHVLRVHEVVLASQLHPSCVTLFIRLKEAPGAGTDKPASLLEDNYHLLCIHPDIKDRLIRMTVSYRYPVGAEDKSLRARADRLFAGLRFEPELVRP